MMNFVNFQLSKIFQVSDIILMSRKSPLTGINYANLSNLYLPTQVVYQKGNPIKKFVLKKTEGPFSDPPPPGLLYHYLMIVIVTL